MSVEHVSCVVIRCDRCNEPPHTYEDVGTAHYDTVEDARKWLVEENRDEPEFLWANDGDEWLCPDCVAERACEEAGGHDWGEWTVYASNSHRACRRGHCLKSERRPIEDVRL